MFKNFFSKRSHQNSMYNIKLCYIHFPSVYSSLFPLISPYGHSSCTPTYFHALLSAIRSYIFIIITLTFNLSLASSIFNSLQSKFGVGNYKICSITESLQLIIDSRSIDTLLFIIQQQVNLEEKFISLFYISLPMTNLSMGKGLYFPILCILYYIYFFYCTLNCVLFIRGTGKTKNIKDIMGISIL